MAAKLRAPVIEIHTGGWCDAVVDGHAAKAEATPSEASAPSSVKISPKARRLAKELGVDIAAVHGTGPGGEILAADIQAASTAPAEVASTQHKAPNIEVPSSIGRLMAERTTQSWTSVPHFFVTRNIDAIALNQYRERIAVEIERTHSVRITHTDLLVALVARVLIKHPRLNASWSAEGIRLHDRVNMGVAIAINDGVVAAVIPNAQAATVAAIATQRRDVAEPALALVVEMRFGDARELAVDARDALDLRCLAQLGVQLVVDEVGRGMGSLDLLARAPIWGLQLDRAWVTALRSDAIARKVCRAGIGMAAALGVTPIATGVAAPRLVAGAIAATWLA